jgi:integrase
MDFYIPKPKPKLETEYQLFQPIDSRTKGLNLHEKAMLDYAEDLKKEFYILGLRKIETGTSFDDMMKYDTFAKVVSFISDELGNDSSHLTRSTKLGYINSYKSLEKDCLNRSDVRMRLYPEDLAKKRSSMRTYKNAIHYVLREELKLEKKNIKRIFTCLNTLLQCPYLLPGVRLSRKLNAPAFEKPRQPKIAIDHLPGNWQDNIYNRATAKIKPYLAILEATGCRPDELEKGVHVKRQNNELIFFIQNAKISGYREIRTAITGRSKELANHLESMNLEQHTFKKNKGALSQYFRDNRMSWGAGFDKITAYFYRYQKATDLKAMQIRGQITNRDVSTALGHLDIRTKNYYIATPSAKNVSVNIKSSKMYR